MATYLADRVIVFEGEPSKDAIANTLVYIYYLIYLRETCYKMAHIIQRLCKCKEKQIVRIGTTKQQIV